MKIKILNFLIFLLLITSSASAQPNQLKFNLVEGPNGRPLGKVNAISQDPNGYIWLAGQSEKCLYRYDGNRWTIYRHDPSNPNSLGLLYIETAYADSKGYIWIGGDGLDQFNPRTGTFKHFKKSENDPASLAANYVNAIFEDSKGRIWIGTEGLDRYDEKTESFIHYKHDPADPGSLSDKVVRSIYEDRKGVIWVGTGEPFFNQDPDKGGLNRLEEDGTFTRFVHDPKDPNSLANNKVRAIFEDSRGVFWIGTSKEIGLHTMDRETGKFQRYPYNPDNPGQLSRPLLKTAQQDKFAHDNDQVTFIIEDTAGEIWISSMWSGINRYNPFTKKMTHYDSTLGFPDRSGWNAFLSRDGVLWISTEQGNLYRVEPFRKTVSTTITGTERVRDFF